MLQPQTHPPPAPLIIPLVLVSFLGCPGEPSNSIDLLGSCRRVVSEHIQETRRDLEGTDTEPGKQAKMMENCDKLGPGGTAIDPEHPTRQCKEDATRWTNDQLKKLQQEQDEALEFCQEFVADHQEFDTASEERKKEIKKQFIEEGADLLNKLPASVMTIIGNRNQQADDARAIGNVFRSGLDSQSPVPSYQGSITGSIQSAGDLIRFTITSGTLSVDQGSRRAVAASLGGTFILRQRQTISSMHIMETSALDGTIGNLDLLGGAVPTGMNTARLSDAVPGFAILDGTELRAVIPVTIENDILPLGYVTMQVPVHGHVDLANRVFFLESGGNATKLFPKEPPGFLMTAYNIIGTAQAGSIQVSTIPGNLNFTIPTQAGETSSHVASEIVGQLQELNRIGAGSVSASRGLINIVGLSANEILIRSDDAGLRVELVP